MAERRMMSKSIIKSDTFLDMPATTQNLYFHMLLDADDDGFVNAPKSIMRIVGAKEDDMKLLIAKQFVISFGSGVIVIKHWKIHNYIQSDRYKPSLQPERKLLEITANKEYQLNATNVSIVDTECIQDVSVGKVRLGKSSIGKVRLDKNIDGECEKPHSPKRKTFTKPTIDEIQDYCIERNNNVNAEQFFDYYESNGWKVGKNSMKDWKAAARTWERNEYRKPTTTKKTNTEQTLDAIYKVMSESEVEYGESGCDGSNSVATINDTKF